MKEIIVFETLLQDLQHSLSESSGDETSPPLASSN